MSRVDFYATRAHWWEHLEPVADELEARGVVCLTHLSEFLPDDPGRLTVVSASTDMKRARDGRRRVVLMQHGAGQFYSDRNASYPGGRGHERCALVLLPNEVAGARHRKFFQPDKPPMAVVGSPHVDEIATIARREVAGSSPVVAVTWHWPMRAMGPEGGTAWTDFGPEVLDQLATMRDLGIIRLLGHGHPKGLDMVRDAYAEREIPFVEAFTDIVAMADVLIADNTSALYEFAALDRPVVVIDSPRWRTGLKLPPRFWSHADVGPRTQDPQRVPAMLLEAILDHPVRQQNRRAICADLFPFRGEAASRAADAIMEVL